MNKVILIKFICMGKICEPKYEYLIKNCENIGIKHVNNSKAFTEYSNTMADVYEKIDDYYPSRKKICNCF